MRNTESRSLKADAEALAVLLTDAKKEERKDRALAVSIRLEALAVHITNKRMTCFEVAELLRSEAKAAYDLANGKYTAQDASTGQKGIVQLSSATDSNDERKAATPKAVKAANDNADKRLAKEQNGKDVPEKDVFVRNVGAARAFSGSVSIGGGGNWTTAEFIVWLENQGAFNHPYWVCKGSWSYGDNRTITDTGCGNIQLTELITWREKALQRSGNHNE